MTIANVFLTVWFFMVQVDNVKVIWQEFPTFEECNVMKKEMSYVKGVCVPMTRYRRD